MKKLLSLCLTLAAILTAAAQNNQIKRIPSTGNDPTQVQYTNQDRGFWIAAEATGGISCHFSGSNIGFTEVDVTGGYRINEFLRAGIGIGARYYLNNESLRRSDIRWAMPLYVNIRGNMIPGEYRNVVPYYSFDIGGTVRDGFMVRPSVGLRIGQPRHAFTIAVSYMGQSLAGLSSNGNKESHYTNFAALRLGYEF